MLVLTVYDIAISIDGGTGRLSKISKVCEKWGRRVQNSVFECVVDYSQYKEMMEEIKEVINADVDSVRFYSLGNSYKNRIEIIGQSNKGWKEESFVY